jgi:hypothetical protein
MGSSPIPEIGGMILIKCLSETLVDKGIKIISATSLLCKSMSWKDIYVHFSFFSHALSLEKPVKKQLPQS